MWEILHKYALDRYVFIGQPVRVSAKNILQWENSENTLRLFVTRSGKRQFTCKSRYALIHNRPFRVEKVKNYWNLFIIASLISIFSYFIQRDSTTGTCSLLGGINVSFSAFIFQQSKTFQRLCSLLSIMEIINMQMCHYLHNGKGYRALPLYQIKDYVVCFPTINWFFFYIHVSHFLRAGHIYSF